MHTLKVPTEINLLGHDEQTLRLARVYEGMRKARIEAALVRDLANIYYLTGRIYRGFIYLNPALDGPRYFVRQPNHLTGHGVHMIRKPEEIPSKLAGEGLSHPGSIAIELDSVCYAESVRLAKAMGMQAPETNLSPVMRGARAVKTSFEQELIKRSGVKHSLVYERIPHLYQEGMTDIEFQIEIERTSRLEGCLGIFRVGGDDMELFMGNILTGENADTPSPYDFAMGGEGLDPSLPVGANGTVIKPGLPVMVDANGNYTGYMTDMTRCFVADKAREEAVKANQLSIDICKSLAAMMKPGVAAADLYKKAFAMAEDAGMADSFMGHRSHAGFVGHGLGIEINEAPVIAPRSRDILEAGNVIAIEPKFVIPGMGAVGIENTYIVGEEAPAECVTTAPEQIMLLD